MYVLIDILSLDRIPAEFCAPSPEHLAHLPQPRECASGIALTNAQRLQLLKAESARVMALGGKLHASVQVRHRAPHALLVASGRLRLRSSR